MKKKHTTTARIAAYADTCIANGGIIMRTVAEQEIGHPHLPRQQLYRQGMAARWNRVLGDLQLWVRHHVLSTKKHQPRH